MTDRKIRCHYLRRDGNQCQNEIAGQPDDDVLLCPRHLFAAWQQFNETVPPEQVARWKRAVNATRTEL